MTIINHIEQTLGLIQEGWKFDQCPEIRAIRLKVGSSYSPEATSLSTLGLSDFVLKINDQKNVRQELLFILNPDFDPVKSASLLVTFATHVKESGKALLRGETIGPGPQITSESQMNCLYISIPVIWEEDLHVFNGMSPPVIFVWVLPLYDSERLFVVENGWSAFEDLLEATFVDFGDLTRKPLV